MAIITSLDQLDFSATYSYTDYLHWQFKERVELLKGKIAKMSPAPNLRHQRISMKMSFIIEGFLLEKPCQVFSAPFDVILPSKKNPTDKRTVVQPDIIVVCDEDKLQERGCFGAPDLVVEILSPGNTKREMKDKFDLYESAGVLEYWIIDPLREQILVYDLGEKGSYAGRRPYLAGDHIPSHVLQGLDIPASALVRDQDENPTR